MRLKTANISPNSAKSPLDSCYSLSNSMVYVINKALSPIQQKKNGMSRLEKVLSIYKWARAVTLFRFLPITSTSRNIPHWTSYNVFLGFFEVPFIVKGSSVCLQELPKFGKIPAYFIMAQILTISSPPTISP